jgi:hypothetical protein
MGLCMLCTTIRPSITARKVTAMTKNTATNIKKLRMQAEIFFACIF